MWIFLLVMLVGFALTFVGVAVSLYFYRQGLVKSSKAERYRSMNRPDQTEEQKAREEQRFYQELTVVENGPSRFSLLIASVVALLICGLLISTVISAFVH